MTNIYILGKERLSMYFGSKSKESNHLLLMVLAGIAIGCLWLISPGCLFMLALVVFATFMLWRFSDAEDRKFVRAIFIIGMGSRIIVYLILGFISILAGRNGWLIGDSWGIYNYAWEWAQQTHDPTKVFLLNEAIEGHLWFHYCPLTKEVWRYGFSGFTYFLGTVYYFFGPLKFSARLLNCLMGVGSGIFIYYIVKDIFGKKCAKLSAILTVFIPSLFLWSITFLKDIPFIFISCIILWSFLRFQKTKRMLFLYFFFLAILAQATIRPTFPMVFIGLILILSYFIISGISWRKKIIVSLCLLILMVPFLHRFDFKNKVNNQMFSVLNYTRGIVNTGGSTYKVFDDKYYNGGPLSHSNYISFLDFTRGFFKGWLYFLLVPFPWKTYTGLQLISYPQTILWYLLIPFVFIGMVTALRYKWKETFVIFAYIIVLGSIIAMNSGNIGTVFRHRDMLTPLFLIFGAVGIIKTFGRLDNFKR